MRRQRIRTLSQVRPRAMDLPAMGIVAPPPLPWPWTWLTPLRDWWAYNVKGIIE